MSPWRSQLHNKLHKTQFKMNKANNNFSEQYKTVNAVIRHSMNYLNLYANGLLAAAGDGSPPQ